MELSNSCICCSINDLADAVPRDQKIDYLVVESKGLPTYCRSY